MPGGGSHRRQLHGARRLRALSGLDVMIISALRSGAAEAGGVGPEMVDETRLSAHLAALGVCRDEGSGARVESRGQWRCFRLLQATREQVEDVGKG